MQGGQGNAIFPNQQQGLPLILLGFSLGFDRLLHQLAELKPTLTSGAGQPRPQYPGATGPRPPMQLQPGAVPGQAAVSQPGSYQYQQVQHSSIYGSMPCHADKPIPNFL